MADRVSLSLRGTLARVEAHLWACMECGSEASVRGTLLAPYLICPMHPEAELRKRAR